MPVHVLSRQVIAGFAERRFPPSGMRRRVQGYACSIQPEKAMAGARLRYTSGFGCRYIPTRQSSGPVGSRRGLL
jgi:hypothetical protein